MTGRDGKELLSEPISGPTMSWRRPVLPPLVFAIGALLSLAAWQGWTSDARFRAQARFDGAVRAIQADINGIFAHYEQILRAGQGFAGGAAAGRGDWRRFTRALDLPGQFPGVKGLALIRPVPAAGVGAFLADRRRDDPGFHIFPDGPRADYFVNTFVEPAAAAAPAIGFDVGSSPPRRAALERARDTGATALTEPVEVLAPSKSGSDFLLYQPVWRDGPPPQTPEERRAALTGWVGLAFNLAEMMRSITLQHPDVDIDIYVGDLPERGSQIYDSQDDETLGAVPDESALYSRAALLPVGGHVWLLSLRSTPAFEAAVAGGEPAMALLAGLALSLALAVTIGRLQRARVRALALADRRAGALEDSETRYRRIIESTLEGYWELDAAGRTVTVNDALCRLLGLQPESLLAQPPDAFAADPARGEFAALLAAAPSSPQRSAEIVLRRRDGEPVPARFNITAFVDADGRVSGAFALISDISAERRRRQELLSSRERLRQIIGAVPFAMLITRPAEGEILHANPHAAALFGLGGEGGESEPGPAPAEHFWLAPEDRREFIETVWRDGRVDSRELRLRRLDGPAFWAIVSAQLFVHDGDAALLVGIQDTDRLKRSEQSLRTLWRALEAAPLSVMITDADGCIEYVNPETERVTGYTQAELIGQNPRLFQSGHTPLAAYEKMWETILAGEVWRGEMVNRRHDGSLFWEAAWIAPVRDAQGRISHFVGLKQDISERRHTEEALRASEQRFRQLFENNRAVQLLLEPASGRIIDANAAAVRYYGYDRDVLRRMTIFQINTLPPAEVLAALAVARAGAKETFYFQHRLASGEVRDVEIHSGPITIGETPVLCSIIHDITLRKEAEAALVRAREEAETANRAKSRFLATMSHELRTPLNTILGFSEIIRDGLMGPDSLPRYAEYAGDIHESGSHLLALISDILDIAKIESGKLEIEPTTLELPAVIQAVVRLVSVRVREAGLEIAVELPEPPPPLVADPRAIKQILFNLLSNAVKFTPRGGRVTLSARAGADGAVRLGVRDTGIGIPADQLERVLKPFEQIDNRYNRTIGGTGLGLALVKSLTELHGGTVEIASVAGEGTTVTVVLPRAPGPPVPSAR